jgi:hypothetical protein
MKLKSVVATAVLAAASWNASAAVYDLGTLDPSGFDSLSGLSAKFTTANTAINDTWNFTLVEPSSTSFAALQTFAVTAGQILNFSAVLSGTNLTQTFGAGSQTLSWAGSLAAGSYSVNVTGTTGLANSQYLATVSAIPTPVPEPETYAMMLGGLALLGAVARRKAKK